MILLPAVCSGSSCAQRVWWWWASASHNDIGCVQYQTLPARLLHLSHLLSQSTPGLRSISAGCPGPLDKLKVSVRPLLYSVQGLPRCISMTLQAHCSATVLQAAQRRETDSEQEADIDLRICRSKTQHTPRATLLLIFVMFTKLCAFVPVAMIDFAINRSADRHGQPIVGFRGFGRFRKPPEAVSAEGFALTFYSEKM